MTQISFFFQFSLCNKRLCNILLLFLMVRRWVIEAERRKVKIVQVKKMESCAGNAVKFAKSHAKRNLEHFY